MKNWICVDDVCSHEVLADERPQPIHWTDGHVCRFREMPEPTEEERVRDAYDCRDWPPGAPVYK